MRTDVSKRIFTGVQQMRHRPDWYREGSLGRDEIAADIAIFLGSGREIQQIPQGATGETQFRAEVSAEASRRRRSQIRLTRYSKAR